MCIRDRGSIAWGQLQNRRPQQANLWRRLQRMGLSAELSQALLGKVAGVAEPRQAWRMLLAHLAHAIKTPKVEPLEEGGVIALVGPAGMGKTTTLAKLAAVSYTHLDVYKRQVPRQCPTLGILR